jgi:hypothetical protein
MSPLIPVQLTHESEIEESTLFPHSVGASQALDDVLMPEYGAKEQQSIDKFLQQLRSFKMPSVDIKLEEMDNAIEDRSIDTPKNSFRPQTLSNEIDIDRILMGTWLE